VKPGRVRGFVDGDAKVPYIACAEIGGLVSVAFSRPADFIGRAMHAVGDFVSGFEIAEILSRLQGRRVRYAAPPAILMRLFAREFYTMRRGFEQYGRPPYRQELAGYIDETRQLWPDTMKMESFLRQRFIK
jgi:hypothetical protein